jgi:thioredoxin reductase (NADPH)
MEKTYDLIIIGAGPVGLYAGFYAGMRGLTVKLIEAFDEAGGQPNNLYPEKLIYDIAGLPAVSGADLTRNLLEQLNHVDNELSLGERVENIKTQNDIFEIKTNKQKHSAKAILITSGAGLLSPRKLNLPDEKQHNESGRLNYFIKNLEDYHDKKVAVLGGGDSALDWALMLEKVASRVHLIHRRTAFRAHELSVAELEKSTVEIHTPFIPAELTESGINLQRVKSDENISLTVDKILVNYGMLTNQLEIMDDLIVNRNGKIPVNRQQKTNIEGIYVAGDACDYEGKVPLMSVGFGEAVAAINDMTKVLELDHKLRKGHSSSLFEK